MLLFSGVLWAQKPSKKSALGGTMRGALILAVGVCVFVLGALPGCRHCGAFIPGAIAPACAGVVPPSDERPSDEPLYLAKRHYKKGEYGLAEQYFRRAVEANDQSVDAWLGLA